MMKLYPFQICIFGIFLTVKCPFSNRAGYTSDFLTVSVCVCLGGISQQNLWILNFVFKNWENMKNIHQHQMCLESGLLNRWQQHVSSASDSFWHHNNFWAFQKCHWGCFFKETLCRPVFYFSPHCRHLWTTEAVFLGAPKPTLAQSHHKCHCCRLTSSFFIWPYLVMSLISDSWGPKTDLSHIALDHMVCIWKGRIESSCFINYSSFRFFSKLRHDQD